MDIEEEFLIIQKDLNKQFRVYCNIKKWNYGDEVNFKALDYMNWLEEEQIAFLKTKKILVADFSKAIENYIIQRYDDFTSYLVEKYGTI